MTAMRLREQGVSDMPHEGWGGSWFPWMPMMFMAFMAFCFFMFRRGGMMRGPRGSGDSQQPRGDGESPLDIAKRRFAKGEINAEELERMKKALE